MGRRHGGPRRGGDYENGHLDLHLRLVYRLPAGRALRRVSHLMLMSCGHDKTTVQDLGLAMRAACLVLLQSRDFTSCPCTAMPLIRDMILAERQVAARIFTRMSWIARVNCKITARV